MSEASDLIWRDGFGEPLRDDSGHILFSGPYNGVIPEPSTALMLFALAGAGLILVPRRRAREIVKEKYQRLTAPRIPTTSEGIQASLQARRTSISLFPRGRHTPEQAEKVEATYRLATAT